MSHFGSSYQHPWIERLRSAGAVAVAVFVSLYFPERSDGSGATVGGVFAFGAVVLGLAAVTKARPLPRHSGTDRLRLMGLSVALGCALGIGNLMANYGIAALDPRIHEHMIHQWAEYSAWSIVFAGPVAEEIGFRLVLMGGTAWLISRFTQDRRIVFLVALAISGLLFGVAHVVPSYRPAIGVLHAVGVALKTSAAGLVLGWVFWRRGLPYSIACHGTANAVHLVAWPAIF